MSIKLFLLGVVFGFEVHKLLGCVPTNASSWYWLGKSQPCYILKQQFKLCFYDSDTEVFYCMWRCIICSSKTVLDEYIRYFDEYFYFQMKIIKLSWCLCCFVWNHILSEPTPRTVATTAYNLNKKYIYLICYLCIYVHHHFERSMWFL